MVRILVPQPNPLENGRGPERKGPCIRNNGLFAVYNLSTKPSTWPTVMLNEWIKKNKEAWAWRVRAHFLMKKGSHSGLSLTGWISNFLPFGGLDSEFLRLLIAVAAPYTGWARSSWASLEQQARSEGCCEPDSKNTVQTRRKSPNPSVSGRHPGRVLNCLKQVKLWPISSAGKVGKYAKHCRSPSKFLT